MSSSEQRTAFIVYSSAGPFDIVPAALKLISGQYVEDGWNHGKRVYKRRPTAAQKFLPEVKLFFWDGSDGKDLGGWWFGDGVGSGQVWSRNCSMTPLPPRTGWRCPSDGPVEKHVVCAPPVGPPRLLLPVKQEILVKEEPVEEATETVWQPGKRPPASTCFLPPAKRLEVKREDLESLVLVSTLGRDAPWGSQRVLGEYVADGQCDGRQAFRKLRDPLAPDDEPVWLHFRDSRDPELAGWWFARFCGSPERYGRAEEPLAQPPVRGWRVPCEGPTRQDLVLLPKGPAHEAALQEEERVAVATALVMRAESEAYKALEASQSVLDNRGSLLGEALEAAIDLLKDRARVVEETMGSVSRHGRMLKQRDHSQEVVGLGERLQVLLESVQQELSRTTWRLESLQRVEAPAG